MNTIKNTLFFVWEVSKIVLIALMIVIPIRVFVFQPFFVKGQSMEPNFHNNDYLIIDELSYRFRAPERGEVVVFKYPRNPSQRYIKRIIGLPDEIVEIQDNQIIIHKYLDTIILDESDYLPIPINTSGTVKISLGEDEYFVMGDNRVASSDSRKWGALPEENIVGRVVLRPWPIAALAKIDAPEY
jgi:signal peptidase I